MMTRSFLLCLFSQRRLALPLLTAATALTLAGTQTRLRAQDARPQQARPQQARPQQARPQQATGVTEAVKPKVASLSAAHLLAATKAVSIKQVAATPAVPGPPTRPNLSEWLMPGMTPLSDQGYPAVASVMAHTSRNYAEVFDYYAKRLGAHHYDLKPLTTFQPTNHALLSGVGLNMDATSSCYVSSQVMIATFCQRSAHETITVCLSTDKPSGETYVSLTNTTF